MIPIISLAFSTRARSSSKIFGFWFLIVYSVLVMQKELSGVTLNYYDEESDDFLDNLIGDPEGYELLPFIPSSNNNRTHSLAFHHPRTHPRIGARYENGSYGLVADPYLVRRTILRRIRDETNIDHGRPTDFFPLTAEEYDQVCNKSVGEGDEKALNVLKLLRPVRVVPSVPLSAPRVLCVVYTHGGVKVRVSAIVETWGWRCDGFFAASTVTVTNETQLGFGSIDLVHLGPEEYNNMWQKTRSILAYLYEHYLDEFHYFHICGDDAFVIPENLKTYLHSLEARIGGDAAAPPRHSTNSSLPLLIGEHLGESNSPYVGGGPGYTLNREALRFYNEESGLMDECLPFAHSPAEDRHISRCLQKKNIWPLKPIDEETGKILVQGLSPHWIVLYTKRRVKPSPENPYFMIPEDLVANETYSWHMMHVDTTTHSISMKRYHAHFYQKCPKDSPRARSIRSDEYLQGNVMIV